MRTALLLVSLLAATACTLPARQTASDIAIAPSACAVINSATGGKLGTACAPVSQDVSDVAKLVQDILESMPKGMTTPPAAPPPIVAFKAKAPSGAPVDVTLPSDLAAHVQARLAR